MISHEITWLRDDGEPDTTRVLYRVSDVNNDGHDDLLIIGLKNSPVQAYEAYLYDVISNSKISQASHSVRYKLDVLK